LKTEKERSVRRKNIDFAGKGKLQKSKSENGKTRQIDDKSRRKKNSLKNRDTI
jgi:hypothetical protein